MSGNEAMATRRKILSIGQCAVDHAAIARAIEGNLPATVEAAPTLAAALARLRQDRFDLVFINRILDADRARGLDVLRAIKADPAVGRVRVMLVTNYPDVQAQAVAAGALAGFGKAALGEAETVARLKAVLDS